MELSTTTQFGRDRSLTNYGLWSKAGLLTCTFIFPSSVIRKHKCNSNTGSPSAPFADIYIYIYNLHKSVVSKNFFLRKYLKLIKCGLN